MDRRTLITTAAALPVAGVSAAIADTSSLDAELLGLGAELDSAWAREKALIDSKTWGDTYEAAYNATSCVVDQIEQQQAHTLEGVQVKVRAVMWCHQGEEEDAEPFRLSHYQRTTDVRLAESIVLDLAEMSIA